MRKLEGIVKEIVDEMDYLKTREERFQSTNSACFLPMISPSTLFLSTPSPFYLLFLLHLLLLIPLTPYSVDLASFNFPFNLSLLLSLFLSTYPSSILHLPSHYFFLQRFLATTVPLSPLYIYLSSFHDVLTPHFPVSTQARVHNFAWFMFASLFGLGVWQIFHLRAFFKRKYLID